MRQKRYRLGVDFHTWDGIFQGSRSYILGLYRAAIVMAPDIDFVFFLKDTESLRDAHAEFSLPNVTLVAIKHLPALARLTVQLPWLQWRHRIDLLHTQYRIPLLRTGACACTIHDVLFETHPRFFSKGFALQSKMSYRHAARNARALFTVSRFSKDELVRLYGVDPARIAVTYNGVDRSRFFPGSDGAEQVRELGLEPGRYLLTVGRLEPRKNHESLIHAYARLGDGVPQLVIVGQRDFSYERVFQIVEMHGLQDRVRFLTSVGDKALPALMRHATIFVYPAYAEGFGMPIIEAMASGVPVIASNTTSMPEVGGDAALYVDPESVEDISAKLASALSDPDMCRRMRSQGIRQADRFDWQESAGVLIENSRKTFQHTRGMDNDQF